MDLLLYNPLEATVIIFCVYLFINKPIRWSPNIIGKLIIDSYILGTIFLFLQNTLLYIPQNIHCVYSIFINFIITPFIIILYYKIDNLEYNCAKVFLIEMLYASSLFIISNVFKIPLLLSDIVQKSTDYVFCTNILIRCIQFGIIFIFLGGKSLKKFLIKKAQSSIKSSIATTQFGWGEPKLSKKLQDEIK